jgi:CubicO group peptidase (beta-lactamase class C family)
MLAPAVRESVTEAMLDNAIPGAAIAVVREGRVWSTEGYGFAHKAVRVTPQTPFMIASLSKAFTAAAVLQLFDAGRVDLDAPVRSYLPRFSVAEEGVSARITVRHLLNHTSGLSDPGYPEMRLPLTTTIKDRVAGLRAARANAEPGNRFQYFNANYAVLAYLVEQVSGVPFETYLAGELFAPLGMHRTFATVTMNEARQKASDLAQGHVELFGLALAWPEGEGNLAGSGGVVSTAEDMARWLAMLAGGGELEGRRVLSQESVSTMRQAAADSPYAMGWFVSSRDGEQVLFHDGMLSTFYAETMLLPRTGDAIVILAKVNSVPHALLGFPRLRNVVLAMLRGQYEPPGYSVRTVGALAAAASVALVILFIRRLFRRVSVSDGPASLSVVRITPSPGACWIACSRTSGSFLRVSAPQAPAPPMRRSWPMA